MALAEVTIKSEDQVLSHRVEVMAVDVCKEFNKVPFAEIKIVEGNVASRTFPTIDEGAFDLGKKIDISVKYKDRNAEEAVIFSGIVTNQGLTLNKRGTIMTVELSDVSVKMTNGRNNALFANKTDSDILKTLVTQNQLEPGKKLKPNCCPESNKRIRGNFR